MSATLEIPELVSVHECPVRERLTAGQMLERLYADFALDLARRKLDGTLADWIKARLNREHRKQPPWSALGSIVCGVMVEPSGDRCLWDDDWGRALTEWLETSFQCPPERAKDLADEGLLEWFAHRVGCEFSESIHGPEPNGGPLSVSVEGIRWTYGRIHGDEDDTKVPPCNPDEIRLWASSLRSGGEDVPGLPDGLARIEEEVPQMLRWDLFTLLMPHEIETFAQGRVPPLPQDLRLPVWGGIAERKEAPQGIKDAADSYKYALEKDRTLRERRAKPSAIYEWLKDKGTPKGYKLRGKDTWLRYIREAKKRGLLRRGRQRGIGT